MDRDILLLVVGALIGFASSILSTFVSYILDNMKVKRQWKREDFLRTESHRQEEIRLAQDFNMQDNLRKHSFILRDPQGEYCFLPQTGISLATHEIRSIESLKVGDVLLSYDAEDEEATTGTIVSIEESEVDEYVVINGSIKVTSSHLFWTNLGWKRSDEINLQSKLFDVNSDYIPVTKIEVVNEHTKVHNLDIENNLPFFAENVLVNTFVGKKGYMRSYRIEVEKNDIDKVEIDEFGNMKPVKK